MLRESSSFTFFQKKRPWEANLVTFRDNQTMQNRFIFLLNSIKGSKTANKTLCFPVCAFKGQNSSPPLEPQLL